MGNLNCVYPDEVGAAVAVTQQMIDAGHRRIGYFAFTTRERLKNDHFSALDREAGYRQAMVKAGLEPVRVLHLDWPASPEEHTQQRRCLARRALSDHADITAWVAYGSREAQCLQMAALERGWHIPEDLSLVTFGDHPTDETGLSLSTRKLPHRTMACQAVERLVRKIEQPTQPLDAVAIPYVERTWGETIVPPRA